MKESGLASPAYGFLCALTAECGGTVKLGRERSEWSLHVVVPPGRRRGIWRGAAFTFANVQELDAHARLLIDWLAGLPDDGFSRAERVRQG